MEVLFRQRLSIGILRKAQFVWAKAGRGRPAFLLPLAVCAGTKIIAFQRLSVLLILSCLNCVFVIMATSVALQKAIHIPEIGLNGIILFETVNLMGLVLLQICRRRSVHRKAGCLVPRLPAAKPKEQTPATQRHYDVLIRLTNHMQTHQLYRKENLTLRQIADAIGEPARQISQAVNQLYGLSIPQYVNAFRISDACRHLDSSDQAICDMVFAVGFTTKSNFHREFSRLTGTNPTAWRRQRRDTSSR